MSEHIGYEHGCSNCKFGDLPLNAPVCEECVVPGFTNFQPPPQTNGDRIREMSDYEMAEWLADILNHCDAKSPTADCLESCPLYKCCNDQPSDNIEDWLKSPAEKDGET